MTAYVHRLALAAAEAYFGRPVEMAFITTPCTHGDVFVKMAQAMLAEMSKPPEEMISLFQGYACCAGFIEEGWAAAMDFAAKEPA